MALLRRILAFSFLFLMVFAIVHCARRGNPTGGPKDIQGPVLVRAEPQNLTTNFNEKRIRLYFDEYIKLEDVQNQLIVSPPLKYQPQISPQGGASRYVEIVLKDTLRENTTYTFNFGQSIVDNNEGNPNSFLTYVFSTGNYIDSLSLSGVIKDAFNQKSDEFVSVMLYEMDTAYTDSTVYKNPPNYITNTLDSTFIFKLENLKAGRYALFALKDEGKNYVFDQSVDKIGFLQDTITLPTDSIYLLTLFREIPDYSVPPPNFAAANKIIFGYNGTNEKLSITPLTPLPDTVRTTISKEPEKDTLNYWFTPFEADSLIFTITNERLKQIDTFTVKTRKLAADSLVIRPSHGGSINFEDIFSIASNIPLTRIDSTKISFIKNDTVPMSFVAELDTVENELVISFEKLPNESYGLELYPGAIRDFFGTENDSLSYRLSTGSYADYGNLQLNLTGAVSYPLIVQLTDERGETQREIYASEPKVLEFNNIEPSNYLLRVIFDTNENGRWDTGNYLKKIQPEKVSYYPNPIEVRANWEKIETFTILE